jgi:hypothetical protein
MVVMFVDCCVGGVQYFPYYSYHRNPMGREFFVPAGTLIAVKLLLGLDSIDADPIRSDDITNSFNFDV